MGFEKNTERHQRILEQKCRYLLIQIKEKSEDLYDDLIDTYEETDLDELDSWFESALKQYKEL